MKRVAPLFVFLNMAYRNQPLGYRCDLTLGAHTHADSYILRRRSYHEQVLWVLFGRVFATYNSHCMYVWIESLGCGMNTWSFTRQLWFICWPGFNLSNYFVARTVHAPGCFSDHHGNPLLMKAAGSMNTLGALVRLECFEYGINFDYDIIYTYCFYAH